MTMQTPSEILPWYRQFWPWFIISLPASAVIAGLITIWIATLDPDGLVADDYYKEGLAVNRDLQLAQRAEALGVQALARFHPQQSTLELMLQGEKDYLQHELSLSLRHPTRPNLDRQWQLQADQNGVIRVELSAPIAQANWHLQLQSDQGQWRISGRLPIPKTTQEMLLPG